MLDALVIGAGPAGLTAASYLARFHRKPVVVDGGASRARWIPESHNIPGFSQGIGGTALLDQLRAQATRYGAEIRSGDVGAIIRVDGGFQVRTDTETWLSRYVVLATGVQDLLPNLPGAEEALLRSVLRVCPICDAFEATGKHIAVIGRGEHGDREAQFLKVYSDRITLIQIEGHRNSSSNRTLAEEGIALIEAPLHALEIEDDRLSLRTREGGPQHFDVFYSALGCTPFTRLAADLGATLDENSALRVDAHQQTSVPGLYAAGDIVRGLNQVVVAAAEGAIAATDIHNRLRADRSARWRTHRPEFRS